MDIAAMLKQLEETVQEAKSMPLSSSVLVNRDEVLQLLKEMQEALPEEIKQARWIIRDREDLLAKARHEAERIVEQAREEQLRMARKEEISERARQEAERTASEADEQAREMKDEAEDYVDAKLAQFENALRKILEESQTASRAVSKTLEQVEMGRERLRGPATAAEQEFAPGEVFDEEEQL